jgi:hypothetical protein
MPLLGPGPDDPDDYELLMRSHARRAIEQAEELEAALHEAEPTVDLRATVDLDSWRKAAGPGVTPEIVQILVGPDPIERLASLVGIAAGIRGVLRFLESRGAAALELDDGVAVLVALSHLTEEPDLTLESVEPIRPTAGEWVGPEIGWRVSLRSRDLVYRAAIDGRGELMDWDVDNVGGAT